MERAEGARGRRWKDRCLGGALCEEFSGSGRRGRVQCRLGGAGEGALLRETPRSGPGLHGPFFLCLTLFELTVRNGGRMEQLLKKIPGVEQQVNLKKFLEQVNCCKLMLSRVFGKMLMQ